MMQQQSHSQTKVDLSSGRSGPVVYSRHSVCSSIASLKAASLSVSLYAAVCRRFFRARCLLHLTFVCSSSPAVRAGLRLLRMSFFDPEFPFLGPRTSQDGLHYTPCRRGHIFHEIQTSSPGATMQDFKKSAP